MRSQVIALLTLLVILVTLTRIKGQKLRKKIKPGSSVAQKQLKKTALSSFDSEITHLNSSNLVNFMISQEQCGTTKFLNCLRPGFMDWRKCKNKCKSNKQCTLPCVKKKLEENRKCKSCIQRILKALCCHFIGGECCANRDSDVTGSVCCNYITEGNSCFDDNTAYSYGEYIVSGSDNIQSSMHDCQQSCSVRDECNFWTWGKTGTEVYGHCYLKSRQIIPGVLLYYPEYISGHKFCDMSAAYPNTSEGPPITVSETEEPVVEEGESGEETEEEGPILFNGQTLPQVFDSNTTQPIKVTGVTLPAFVSFVAIGGGGGDNGQNGGNSGFLNIKQMTITGDVHIEIGKGGTVNQDGGDTKINNKVVAKGGYHGGHMEKFGNCREYGHGTTPGGWSGGGGYGYIHGGQGGSNGSAGDTGCGNSYICEEGSLWCLGDKGTGESFPINGPVVAVTGGSRNGRIGGGGAGIMLENQNGDAGSGYGAGGNGDIDGRSGAVIFFHEKMVTRKNISSIGSYEQDTYNKALKLVKEWKGSRSFTSIAEYHGLPYQCNQNQTDIGEENGCCIAHWYQDGSTRPDGTITDRRVLFVPWHRLYVYQLEKALRIASDDTLGLPYWDWTAEYTDDKGKLILPQFVQQGEWKNGPINKELNKNEVLTSRSPRLANYTQLRKMVKQAYDETNFKNFNLQIVDPHNKIHVWTGGNMGTVRTASYDPIFFLHHSNVDLQYAYFQELQTLRHKTLTYGEMGSFSMYPFASSKNPFWISKQYSTGPQCEDYKNHFSYKYDNLIFEGLTPQQYIDRQKEENKQRMLFAGTFLKHTGITSTIYFDCVHNNTSTYGGDFTTFGSLENPNFTTSHEKNVVLLDVTTTFSDIDQDKNHKFVVTEYTDAMGNDLPINETYRPIVVYKEANSLSHIFRLHVEDIHEYAPVMYGRIGHHVEFLKNGQVVSGDDDVKTWVGGTEDDPETGEHVNGIVPIEYQEHKFIVNNEYGQNNIIIGYDMDTFEGAIGNSRKSLNSGNQVIPWKLEWLKKNPTIYATNCPGTKILITSSDETLSLVRKVDKIDYDNCTNLWSKGIDGIYGLLVDTSVPGIFYYAEGKKIGTSKQNYCNLGWKIAINISDCNEK